MDNRYENIKTILKTGKGKVYDSTLLSYVEPTDTDIVILTTMGDRLDLLANEYYGDSTMWWVIALKNNITDVDLTMKGGIKLRIPSTQEAAQLKNSMK
jgi:hypothetical protein